MTDTASIKKVSDLIAEASSINCSVKKSLAVVNGFLQGPMCGKCFPCSFGSYEAKVRLGDIAREQGSDVDIETVRKIASNMQVMSMCKKGKDIAEFLLDQLKHEDFSGHLHGECAHKECKAFIEYRNVPENCIRCGKCQDACRYDAIVGERKKSALERAQAPFEIRQRRCTKCGECIKVCPTKAIVIVSVGPKEKSQQ